jgi:hypothetical protein
LEESHSSISSAKDRSGPSEPFQGFLELLSGRFLGSPVHFSHEKDSLVISVAQGFPHFHFGLTISVVTVPRVIHEINAVVGPPFGRFGSQDRPRTSFDIHSDRRNGFAGSTKAPIQHVALSGI